MLYDKKVDPPYNPNVVSEGRHSSWLIRGVSVFSSDILLEDIKSIVTLTCYFCQQTGQLDLRHFDPEFVREPVPGIVFS